MAEEGQVSTVRQNLTVTELTTVKYTVDKRRRTQQ